MLAPTAFTTHERSHINFAHLNIERKSRDVRFPFRLTWGTDEKAVRGKFGNGVEVYQEALLNGPADIYPLPRRDCSSAVFEQGSNA